MKIKRAAAYKAASINFEDEKLPALAYGAEQTLRRQTSPTEAKRRWERYRRKPLGFYKNKKPYF